MWNNAGAPSYQNVGWRLPTSAEKRKKQVGLSSVSMVCTLYSRLFCCLIGILYIQAVALHLNLSMRLTTWGAQM